MKMTKAILTIALTLALSIALTTHLTKPDQTRQPEQVTHEEPKKSEVLPTPPRKRVSRFLAEKEPNPRASNHCRKDGDVCIINRTYSTCCNNKCVDLRTDKNNCGACKNKCKFTHSCCNRRCVNRSYDKRNCGYCGVRCAEYCIYGVCDYA